jgi:hypothetical protein
MMKIRYILFIAFLGVEISVCAQKPNLLELLQTADSDLAVTQQQSLQGFAEGLNMRDPLLSQIQLRLGINGDSREDTLLGYWRNEDTYQVQLRFNSLLERQRQQQIKAQKVAVLGAKIQVLRQKAIAKRAFLAVEWATTQTQLQAARRLDSLLVYEQQILRDMLASGVLEVKVSKVLSVEEDLLKNRRAIMQLERDLTLYAGELSLLTNGTFRGLDPNTIVGVTDIEARLARWNTAGTRTRIVDLKYAEVALRQAELNYTNAQNRQVFNHVQAGYQRPLRTEAPPKRFNPNNNMGFRIGLTVPLPSNNNFKKASDLLQLREAELDAIFEQQQADEALQLQHDQLVAALNEHTLISQQSEKSLIKAMLQNPTLRAQISPLEYTELEIAQQQLTIAQTDAAARIMLAWVRLLDAAGLLHTDAATWLVK